MTIARSLLLLMLCAACRGDETVFAYGAGGKTWQLVEIDRAAYAARATLSFPEPGRIEGQAPCNRFSGPQIAPYPWFETGDLAVTRATCPEAPDEARFFSALSAMTQSEVLGNSLILRDESGREMVFKAQ